MEKKIPHQGGLSPKELWQKHKSNIVFVVFLAWMILFPRNPVRIAMTKGTGIIRTTVERLELPRKKQQRLRPEDMRWQLIDSGGKIYSFKDFSDKPVVINVWATWCPPCVAELPSLIKLHETYGNRVHFIFLADDRPEKVRQFLQQKNWNIPVYYSGSKRPFLLQSESIPATFIIDRHQIIRVRKTGAMNWNTPKVKKLMDKLLREP